MVTVTVVAPGMARIDVTARDPYNRLVRGSFHVEVINQAPMVQTDEPTRFGPFMPLATQDIMLSRYFSDPEDESLMYTAMSDMTDYVTVSAVGADSTITITAVAAGEAMITITANDGTNDAVSHMLIVTVVATAPPANNAPTSTGINDVSLQVGGTKDLTLSMYFTDADGDPLTFTAMSSMPAYAAVSGPDANSMITITAVAAGSSMITVTASDGTDSVSDTFEVTVSARPNMAPQVKGEGLPDIKRVLADGQAEITTDDTVEVTGIDLSMYFEDPEAYPLVFTAEVMEQDPDGAVAIAADMGSKPDGTDFDKLLSIDLKMAGKATIKVTARDNADLTVSDTFEITIGAANVAPAMVSASQIEDQEGAATETANTRLVIGESRPVIDDLLIHDHFTDEDFTTGTEVQGVGEMLTFEVKFFPFGIDAEAAILAATDELEAGKEGVTATLSTTTWNGIETSTFTLTLMAVRATDVTENEEGHVVALIATDQYNAKVAHVFNVRVNHDPENEGSEGKLSSASDDYDDMVWDARTGEDDTEDVDLNLYFSDKDGDTDIASCGIVGKTGTAATFTVSGTGTSISLEIDPEARGTSTVSVRCTDTFGQHSDSDTLTVVVASSVTESRH